MKHKTVENRCTANQHTAEQATYAVPNNVGLTVYDMSSGIS